MSQDKLTASTYLPKPKSATFGTSRIATAPAESSLDTQCRCCCCCRCCCAEPNVTTLCGSHGDIACGEHGSEPPRIKLNRW
jgi:hypothetical protein